MSLSFAVNAIRNRNLNVSYVNRKMEVLHQENWTSEVTSSLKKFEKQLIIAMKEKGWDGKEDESTVTWTFAGALFYCITVITTIGNITYHLLQANTILNLIIAFKARFFSTSIRIWSHSTQDSSRQDCDNILRYCWYPHHCDLLVQHR